MEMRKMDMKWASQGPRGEKRHTSGNEGKRGKESKLTCSWGRLTNCGRPTRNWAT